jgi:orotate phosphoribosyltransferase
VSYEQFDLVAETLVERSHGDRAVLRTVVEHPVLADKVSSVRPIRDLLLDEIVTKAVVRGRVMLSSGAEADYYIDLRRIALDGFAAPLVGRMMLDLTRDWDYDAVGGLTLGADPVAAAMLHASAAAGEAVDAFIVRKADKVHGLQRRIEGPGVAGRRVVAVEDTSTTGASVLTAVEALREAGAQVIGVAVLVDRGARAAVESAGLPFRAAYSLADLGMPAASTAR